MVADMAPVVGASVDWISMSSHAPSGVAALLRYRDVRSEELRDAGWTVKPWGGHGYAGVQFEQIRFASNRSSVLLQLSGERASRDWRGAVAHATNVSRLDLATTARPDPGASAVARDSYHAATAVANRAGRPIAYTLLTASDGADTLYVGKRASDQFGRLYNKGLQSKEAVWEGCWRYEVEFKRAMAKETAKALLAAPDEKLAVEGTCHRWFSARRVTPCYRPGSVVDPVTAPSAVADDERWLAWVRRCVQPRARELAVRYGWRYVAEACVGRIETVEDYLTLCRGIEFELEVTDIG